MSDTPHVPVVPDHSKLREFTIRALVLGLIMCVILGAANAYLGLKAGMTIAATYPADDVALYLSTLLWQDPETWGALADAPQRQQPAPAS